MTGLCLATKGKVCKRSSSTVVEGGGLGPGGIIYRDKYKTKEMSKEECELMYFPKIETSLAEEIKEDRKILVIATLIREY